MQAFPVWMLLKSSNAGDFFEPGKATKPYTLVDAGTHLRPSDAALWMAYEEEWAPDVASVHSRLKKRLWNLDGTRTRNEVPQMTKAQVERLEDMLDSPPEPPPYEVTLQQLAGRVPSPSHVVKTTRSIEDADDVKGLMAEAVRRAGESMREEGVGGGKMEMIKAAQEPTEVIVQRLVSDYGIDLSGTE